MIPFTLKVYASSMEDELLYWMFLVCILRMLRLLGDLRAEDAKAHVGLEFRSTLVWGMARNYTNS